MAKPFDRDEVALVQLLTRAGVAAPAAQVFAALARGGGHGAVDLAAATGLSRQDAGDAANALVVLGLARVEKLASGPSGGRPTNRYFLAAEGIPALVAVRRSAIQDELRALDELAARFAGRERER